MVLVWLFFIVDMLVAAAIGHLLFFDLGRFDPFRLELATWWTAFAAALLVPLIALGLARTGHVALGLALLALVALPGVSLLPVQAVVLWSALRFS